MTINNPLNDNLDPQSMLLYSDADLLVINKPAGLLSIQDGYDRSLPHLATIMEPVFGKVWTVHRLDKDTSGVMLLGRNADTHRYFNELFKSRTIEKTYHCLVLGHPIWEEKLVNLPLAVNADRLHRTRVDEIRGKPAKTGIEVLKRYDSYTLLACQLFTGYTHQIRAHLFHLELPILGDSLYCQRSQRQIALKCFGLARLALHAYSISFDRPHGGQYLTFMAPYPPDFAALL